MSLNCVEELDQSFNLILVKQFFSIIFYLFLLSSTRAMPPMEQGDLAGKGPSRIFEDVIERDRIKGEAEEDSHNDEESDTSSQWPREVIEGIKERESAQSASAPSIEERAAEKQTCDPKRSHRRISGIMDRVRALGSRFVPNIFRNSKNVSDTLRAGSFSGVPINRVAGEPQRASLESRIVNSVDSRVEEECVEPSSTTPKEGSLSEVPIDRVSEKPPQDSLKSCMMNTLRSRAEEKRKERSVTFQDRQRESLPGQDELESYSLALEQLQQELKRSVKEISENDPERMGKRTALRKKLNSLEAMPEKDPVRLAQIAQIHAEAYPQARAAAQKILRLAQEDPARQRESTAHMLVDATISILEIASKTVASQELVPIQRTRPVVLKSDRPLEPPYLDTNLEVYEEYKLPIEDLEHVVIVSAANRALKNLQAFKEVLEKISLPASPEEIGGDLRQAEIYRIRNALDLSYEKSNCIDAKLQPLRDELIDISVEERDRSLMNQFEDQLRAQSDISKSLHSKLVELRASDPIVDPAEAKRVAVAEVISLSQSGLEAADDFREMLEQRRKKD